MLSIQKTLNPSLARQNISNDELNRFRTHLQAFIDRTNDHQNESEEFHKNNLTRFLQQTRFADYYINTKERIDLVIHTGNAENTPTGVIFEHKRPGETHQMLTETDLNRKSLQQLLYYFLRETITEENYNIRHLIITNNRDFFVFDSLPFRNIFVRNNPSLRAEYDNFEKGRLDFNTQAEFYDKIASKYIDTQIVKKHLPVTRFNIEDYRTANNQKLKELYLFLSPAHLLKEDLRNDANRLNKEFYFELLHLIGVEEVAEDGKILIKRLPKEKRNDFSLLENSLYALDSDKFEEGLELSLIWINRILFLKLLETQLIDYHGGDSTQYGFLNTRRIANFDDLNILFFHILAKKLSDRSARDTESFKHIPYLNSSLFEPIGLERQVKISNLKHGKMPVYPHTVLCDNAGKRKIGEMDTLQYLFSFLDAYDFSSSQAGISTNGKTIINAAVLGLIFEKINGYRDGSFFTPSYISMYICRETIRKAVLRKFNHQYNWSCTDFAQLTNQISEKITKRQANELLNTLRVCDPAVGSGHFLVSALNEIILIKYDLNILIDEQQKTISKADYNMTIESDELIITNESGKIFTYHPQLQESLRVQKTLFHEKQTLIENCLFGADINPNSVKICRLRLWIELLKNAYYKETGELETLPNIDINIKCGNSLISKFGLEVSLQKALKTGNRTIESYRNAVATYRTAKSRREKQEMEQLIADMKKEFRIQIGREDKKYKQFSRAEYDLYHLTKEDGLFSFSDEERKQWEMKVEQKRGEVARLKAEIEAIENNPKYQHAVEWRFEFPEVLDDDGNFTGFDVIVSNPPYISLQRDGGRLIKDLESANYQTLVRTGDIYTLFFEKGIELLCPEGYLNFITSNKWMRAGYGEYLRRFLLQQNPLLLIDLGAGVFDAATVDTNILEIQKTTNRQQTRALTLSDKEDLPKLRPSDFYLLSGLTDAAWLIQSPTGRGIKSKIEKIGTPLIEWDVEINYGIKTGYNEAFVIDKGKKDELIAADPKNNKIIKPLLRGRDIQRYKTEFADRWLIATHTGYKSLKGKVKAIDINSYPIIKSYLEEYWNKIEKRDDQGKTPYHLRSCTYMPAFRKKKIVWKRVGSVLRFCYDNNHTLLLDSTCFLVGENIKYLLALLNSKVSYYYLLENSPKTGTGDVITSVQALAPLPIPQISDTAQAPFVQRVDKILRLKSAGKDTQEIEEEIDSMVYELYGFSPEEIEEIEKGLEKNNHNKALSSQKLSDN